MEVHQSLTAYLENDIYACIYITHRHTHLFPSKKPRAVSSTAQGRQRLPPQTLLGPAPALFKTASAPGTQALQLSLTGARGVLGLPQLQL